MKRVLKSILLAMLVFSMCIGNVTTSEAKVKISKKSKTMYVGDSYKLKVTGTKKKTTWSSSNKKVATVNKGLVRAKKKGNARITAKVAKKKYTCKITVKNKTKKNNKVTPPPVPTPPVPTPPVPTPPVPTPPVPTPSPENVLGSRTNPRSAYEPYTTDIYRYGTYLGKFTVQLKKYLQGEEAWNYILENIEYQEDPPTDLSEYIYVEFSITYVSGNSEVRAQHVVNHFSNFYNTDATKEIDNESWAYVDDITGIPDFMDVELFPGESVVCQTSILIEKGNTPITYCLETGFDANTYETKYTWFKTY